MNTIPSSHKSAKIAIFSYRKNRVPNKIETWINQNSVVTGIWTDPEKDKSLAVLFLEQSLVEKRYFSKIAVLYISALASAPSRPPNPTLTPQNQASSKKNSFKSPKNSKNRVCLQWTLYQVVTNRPKSRFSAAKKIGFLIIKKKLELIKIVSWPAYEPTLKKTSL